jgi:hypothetical protein
MQALVAESAGAEDHVVSRHPASTDAPTHGWRWYRVEDNRLVSPIVGRVPLPRNGLLDGAYFIPRAEDIWPVAIMIAAERWYAFALTFGEVQGPLEHDPTMPLLGSMKSTRYQALTILSTATNLQQSYDVPVVGGLLSEELMLAVERAVTHA